MRRYELMLVLRPDTADDRVQQILDRTTRGIAASEGQIVKVSPWGRRRLAYPISSYREGSYFIIVFEAPSEAIDELERGLNITEEVMRHLVTRIERPAGRRGEKADDADEEAEADVEAEDSDLAEVLPVDDELEIEDEVIDESETEAAPKAV
jgi:small subunit ribosomal protein S6